MDRVRIGFVGGGGMGQMAHLSNYAVLAQQGLCEIVALAEPKAEQARLVAARYGIPRVYPDHAELLVRETMDAVVAPQPYRRHSLIVPDVLLAGIPVFTEKPLCLTVEAGERLVEIGRRMRTLHMVGYHKRSDPAVEYAKSLVDKWKSSGEYGRMRYVRVTMPPGDWMHGADKPILTEEPIPDAQREPAPADMDEKQARAYDVFVNYYIHQVNMVRFMLGDDYRVTYAEPSQVLLVGISAGGICATIEMEPYRTTHEWHESVLVGFERAFIKVDLPAPLAQQEAGKVAVMCVDEGGGAETVHPALINRSAMMQQAMNFIAAVRGERRAPCEAEEALKDLRVARDYIRMIM